MSDLIADMYSTQRQYSWCCGVTCG
uniref:Uncharacterized protein n=1 Tax=Arundo donax TaxID=35708 RepID=A0A0A9ET35_ARUDO